MRMYLKQLNITDTSKLKEYQAVELGNNFQLGTKYSKSMELYYTDENGEMKVIRRKAQLLSNTCDASRDELLLFAAVHPLSDIHDNDSMISNIVRNKRYSAFYLPDRILKDDYVDFELINSMSRETFLRLYQEQKVKRIASLTMVGYYMFICKLTVFFMRPEDVEVNSDRYVPA